MNQPKRRASAVCGAIVVAILVATGAGAHAATWFTDAARLDDTGDGASWATAKRTLAAAIGASAAGDTILVRHGLYPLTSAVVLDGDRCLGSDDGTHLTWAAATPDSSQCILSAAGTSRAMTITGAGVTGATVIRGFTLTGGNATSEGDPNNGYGGGLDINGGADPIVERCRIAGNVAGSTFNGRGGGVSVQGNGTAPVIRHCRIDDNTGSTAWYAYGGGLFSGSGTAPEIHDCVITGNRGSTARVGYGGGIAMSQSNATVRWCEITANVAATASTGVGGRGGGVYIYPAATIIEDCVVTDNVATEAVAASGYGGGIYCEGGAPNVVLRSLHVARNVAATAGRGEGGGISTGAGPLIENNLIEDNRASTSDNASENNRYGIGGGVKLADSGTRLCTNVIRGNAASLHGEGRGGGIYFESANTIERNVIANNVASGSTPGYGGGVYTGGGYHTSFRNNTVVGNANVTSAGASGAGSGFYQGASGDPYVENNLFCGHDIPGSDGCGYHSDSGVDLDYNGFHGNAGANVNANVNSTHEMLDDPSFVDAAAGDYHLAHDSPCIEAGNPATPVPEHGGWVVDLGAFEYTGERHERAIDGAGEYLFGGRVRAKVNLLDAGSLTLIDMVVHPGIHHPGAPDGVARYYEIEAVGTGPLFELTLSYLDDEVGDEDEAALALWRHDGTSWQGPLVPIARDLAANWLTVGEQTGFSAWAIAEDIGEVPVLDDGLPNAVTLVGNHPNPFNPATRIDFRLPRAAMARLAIYDAAGRLVRTLIDGECPAGEVHATWDGRADSGAPVASGVYFYELSADGAREARKMVMTR